MKPKNGTHPKIDASPTKASFIAVLIRDVDVIKAISELVDNSVDGAKRSRPDGDFNGLKISITFDKNTFQIEDNCGGIPINIAEDYAFRFGRPATVPKEIQTNLPIGQFGVGMKRALFKLGKHFLVKSVSPTSSFTVPVDVDEWKNSHETDKDGFENWEFDFDEYNPNEKNQLNKCGTVITINPLNPSVADELSLKSVRNKIIEAIQSEQSIYLRKKLKIIINGIELTGKADTLLKSNSIKPFYKSLKIPQTVKENGKEITRKVAVRLYAGISEVDYASSGWYIYCNGRQILKADKTKATGWGQEVFTDPHEKEKVRIPKGHPQFSRFRGYAYFECSDASLLPWNTTKSGIDLDSPVYQVAKLDMMMATREIIDFLNRLDNEIDNGEDFLSRQIAEASEANINLLPQSSNFAYKLPTKSVTKTVRISYRKPVSEVEEVKEFFDVNTAEDVGIMTFDYFMEAEIDNG